MKEQNWKTNLIWVLLAEGVGFLSGWLTREGTQLYNQSMVKPPFSPPAIVFPVVWAILFGLMGIGAARVYQTPASDARSRALKLFFLQLAFNFVWSLIFFNAQAYGLAFFWLVALWVLILGMILAYSKVDRTAARLQVPYLLWVTFAGYLNLGVWLLNR